MPAPDHAAAHVGGPAFPDVDRLVLAGREILVAGQHQDRARDLPPGFAVGAIQLVVDAVAEFDTLEDIRALTEMLLP